jgi:hypothetical protein
MLRAAVDHAEDGSDDAADGSDLPAAPIARGGQRVIVPEQFVGAVDEIDVQRESPGRRVRLPGS